jgi:DNA polymerase III delta prime subunit
MFAGPAGTGKFTLAVQLAKTILCDHPLKEKNAGRIPHLEKEFPLTLPCGTCDSCKALNAGNHPDFHIITKELIRYHDSAGKSKGTNLSIHVIRGPSAAKAKFSSSTKPTSWSRPPKTPSSKRSKSRRPSLTSS